MQLSDRIFTPSNPTIRSSGAWVTEVVAIHGKGKGPPTFRILVKIDGRVLGNHGQVCIGESVGGFRGEAGVVKGEFRSDFFVGIVPVGKIDFVGGLWRDVCAGSRCLGMDG